MEVIYVRVIEGSDGYEPVNAIKIKDNVYKLIDKEDSYDEIYNPWEFPPGTLVRTEFQELVGIGGQKGFYLVAVSEFEL